MGERTGVSPGGGETTEALGAGTGVPGKPGFWGGVDRGWAQRVEGAEMEARAGCGDAHVCGGSSSTSSFVKSRLSFPPITSQVWGSLHMGTLVMAAERKVPWRGLGTESFQQMPSTGRLSGTMTSGKKHTEAGSLARDPPRGWSPALPAALRYALSSGQLFPNQSLIGARPWVGEGSPEVGQTQGDTAGQCATCYRVWKPKTGGEGQRGWGSSKLALGQG